ncbi:MAG: beta strand repeat-containing protein, partial [Achromobacter pestifer]
MLVGDAGAGTVTVQQGAYLSSQDGHIGRDADSNGMVSVSNGRWENSGELRVGDLTGGMGTLEIGTGGVVSNTNSYIGSMGGTGNVSVKGAGAVWNNAGALKLGSGIGVAAGNLTIANNATVNVGSAGTGTLVLAQDTLLFYRTSGTINIGGAAGQAAVGAGALNAGAIQFGAGNATLNFNHTDTGYQLAASLQKTGNGTHALNQIAGSTTLTGASDSFKGLTTVSGGSLVVLGSLGGSANVTGGRLQYGNATTGSANNLTGNLTVTGAGSTLAIQGPATVAVTGDVTLANGTVLDIMTGASAPSLKANSVTLGNNVAFTLSGIADRQQLGTILIDTASGISGDFATVSVGGFTGEVDYLTVNTSKTADNLKYAATYAPSWTANNNLAHGTFTLTNASDFFAVGLTLSDQTPNAATGWNGKTLTKAGAGTLVLSGNNTYSGGTNINGGTLRVDRDANLGATAGGLTFGGGTLAATGSFDTARTITLAQTGRIDVATGATLGLTGGVSGGAGLIKAGSGTLRLDNAGNAFGNTWIESGTLIGQADSISGNINNLGTLVLNQTANGTVVGAISGTGAVIKNGAGTLTLAGNNTYTGGTSVLGGTLIGDSESIRGNLRNDAVVVFNQTAQSGIYDGQMLGAGSVTKRGSQTLYLTGANVLDWNIEDGTLASSAQRYTANTAIGSTGRLTLEQTAAADHAGRLTGTGHFEKTGAASLTLTADNSGFAGTTSVLDGALIVSHGLGGNAVAQNGKLVVNGTLGGSATVEANGSLAGSGTISQDVVLTGGTLLGTQGQALKIGGNLTLDSASKVNVALGGASTQALFDVGGNLTLAGTLNVTDLGEFGSGVYRLFDYGGTLINNGLNIGSTPSGVNANHLTVQTAVHGQVNLASTAGMTLGYWDGGNTAAQFNGVVDGGSGVWRIGGRNWTGIDGALNGSFLSPTFATFQGTAGTVTVDNAMGAINVTGMAFDTDGYRIEGDSIALQGSSPTAIRVGTGNTATIASSLTGTNQLMKSDFGTLVLEGVNTYTGGTALQLGKLSVSSDANLGAASGGLTMMGGALATTASFNSGRTVNLAQNGAIDVATGTQLGLAGVISGGGTLIKQGVGTLTLTGVNTYANTTVQAGTLIGNADSIKGTLNNNGSVVFEQNVDGTYSGMVIGSGNITKRGAGTLTLGNLNAQAWNIEAGTLVGDASRYVAHATIGSAGTLRFVQSTDAAYAGKLSGSGAFTKTGTGSLQLSADSSAFTGITQVQNGTLSVSGKLGGNAQVVNGRLHVSGTLGGDVAVGSGTVLSGSGTIGQNVVVTGGSLLGMQGQTMKIGGNLTLDGASQVNVALGQATSTALFKVGGDLALAGTLNVTDQGAFGAGIYRLFDYGGALTSNTLGLGTAPPGIATGDLRIQTAVNGQVNLTSTTGALLSFWDGGNA